MRTGRLDEFVTFEARTATQDDHGQEIETWTPVSDLTDLHAGIDTGQSRKFLAQQQIHGELTHIVTLRYIHDHTAAALSKMRLRHGTRILIPLGPPQDSWERQREITINCQEIIE